MSADIARDRLEWILGFDHRCLSDPRGAKRDSILSGRGFSAGRGARLRWPQQVDERRERQIGKSRDHWSPDDRVRLGMDPEAFNEAANSKKPALMETMDPAVKIALMEKDIGKPLEKWTADDLAALPSFAELSNKGKAMIAHMLDDELQRRLPGPKEAP